MDFQGQGKALTGETEALALIDPTSRYVVVIPLVNREAKTWLQPFLDRIVFTFGAPNTLHSDAAPEFLSEALALLAQAADIRTTTTLGHNARDNGTIEVFWRFWNRCLPPALARRPLCPMAVLRTKDCIRLQLCHP
jgi:transposase InsO family protein